ncbi:MAG: hypothetical protein QXW39_03420 [Candidatus Bathyarchaeia archaeon]
MDFYNRQARILSLKEKFSKNCPHCYKILEEFEYDLKLNSYSIGRIEKYWSFLKAIHERLGVCFDKAKRGDVEKLIVEIDDDNKWSEWTKIDFKKIIKFFYRWLKNGSLEGDYPSIVKWIKVKMKRKKPEDS